MRTRATWSFILAERFCGMSAIPDDQIRPGGVEQPVAKGINTATRTLRSQLKEIGYSPRDITYLAVSHGHADHVANANEYAGSTLLLQSRELEFMFSEGQRKESFFPTYSALNGSKTIKLTGDHDVFGDGTVVLKSTPGHTPGHQSLRAPASPPDRTTAAGHYPAARPCTRQGRGRHRTDQGVARGD